MFAVITWSSVEWLDGIVSAADTVVFVWARAAMTIQTDEYKTSVVNDEYQTGIMTLPSQPFQGLWNSQ